MEAKANYTSNNETLHVKMSVAGKCLFVVGATQGHIKHTMRERETQRGVFIEVKNGSVCGDACNYFTS